MSRNRRCGTNLPCSKRLKVILPLWLPGYVQSIRHLSSEASEALLKISASTIDHLLLPTRIQYKKRGRTTTKPGTLIRKHIPIKTNQWDESRPGFLEADSVAHCGQSLSRMFVYTIDCVDIATGWSDFDSNNGGKFLNYHLFKHFTQRKRPVWR